jgi:hypothetical protein
MDNAKIAAALLAGKNIIIGDIVAGGIYFTSCEVIYPQNELYYQGTSISVSGGKRIRVTMELDFCDEDIFNVRQTSNFVLVKLDEDHG